MIKYINMNLFYKIYCKLYIIVKLNKYHLHFRFCHKIFDNNYKATIGVDFEVEKFDILGVPFHLQMCVHLN